MMVIVKSALQKLVNVVDAAIDLAKTLLAPSTVTTSGNAGSQVVGAGATLVVSQIVGAVSGTTPSLTGKLQESIDGTTWTDVAGGGFTAVTASNNVQSVTVTTTKQYVQYVYTISGTTPSFAAAVVFQESGGGEGPFAKAYLGLYVAAHNPGVNDTLSSITEAGYGGYARQQVELQPSFDQGDGSWHRLTSLMTFRPTDSVTPQTAYGYFYADALTGGNLIALESFLSPVPLNSPSDACPMVGEMACPQLVNYGSGTVVA